jgi:hypothetical protein
MNIYIKKTLAFWATVPFVYLAIRSEPLISSVFLAFSIVEEIIH